MSGVHYLRTARCAGRGDDGVAILAYSRQQAILGDLHAQRVMLITEAASHAAAAGIHLGDIGARDQPQEPERIS